MLSSALAPWMSRKSCVSSRSPGPVVDEDVVVGDQWMHPVDGDELLGQRVRGAVVVRWVFGMPPRACASISQMPSLVSQSLAAVRTSWPSCRSRALGARIAGVHSTVWILAISAETIRRALW